MERFVLKYEGFWGLKNISTDIYMDIYTDVYGYINE